jgi:SAM-dependent methyltransferase
MSIESQFGKIRTKIKKEVSRLIKRQLQDMCDHDTEVGQYISLLQLKEKLPPIPPKALQTRVAGAYYPEFFKHGRDMFYDIENILKKQGLSAFNFDRILDFGCGCGRFLIPLSFLMSPGKLCGTDIDGQAIQWLKENYACFDDLNVNDSAPPTKYPDGTFDFVFSVSIFTHLPEEMQDAWLKELSRIVKPGGYGVFTVQGENFFHQVTKNSARIELLKKGFFYQNTRAIDGLPEFYQTAYHTHEYIRREWSRYFEVVAVHSKGVGNHQDAVLVRKRTP